MVLPLIRGYLVHDFRSEPVQEERTEQRLPALQVVLLHLILVVLVEDMQLEYL